MGCEKEIRTFRVIGDEKLTIVLCDLIDNLGLIIMIIMMIIIIIIMLYLYQEY